jgi:hypothetical protein
MLLHRAYESDPAAFESMNVKHASPSIPSAVCICLYIPIHPSAVSLQLQLCQNTSACQCQPKNIRAPRVRRNANSLNPAVFRTHFLTLNIALLLDTEGSSLLARIVRYRNDDHGRRICR